MHNIHTLMLILDYPRAHNDESIHSSRADSTLANNNILLLKNVDKCTLKSCTLIRQALL